jgi:hypothetical protein
VLQYGPSAGGGGEYWSLASWYVTVDAGFLISSIEKPRSGDWIFGNMTLLGPDTWFIGSQIVGGREVTLRANKQRLRNNPWAYVTLEVYNDSGDCREYPKNPQLYKDMSLTDASNKPISAQWTMHKSVSPICGEHMTVESPEHVTIHFGEN